MKIENEWTAYLVRLDLLVVFMMMVELVAVSDNIPSVGN